MKNPIVAAIANAVLPGLGYILIQRRTVFGWWLLAGSLVGWVWTIKFPIPEEFFMGESMLWCAAAYLLTMVAFAYDAYTEAKHR